MVRRWFVTLGVVALVLGGSVAAPAFASGSPNLYPTDATCAAGGNCRPGIEWRTDVFGPSAGTNIPRRTLFTVYAEAGENILLGSSSIGLTGNADAVIWNPGRITDQWAAQSTFGTPDFSCVAQRATVGNGSRGALRTRAQELAGAQSIDGTSNTSGYAPCYYTAPTTGLYNVAFYGQNGTANTPANPPGPAGTINPGTFATPAATSVAVDAWDITVRPTGAANGKATDVPGRTFTYVIAANSGGNARPVAMTFYLNTLDGFRYRVNTNGFDPNAFVFYGNQTGFLNADDTPLNHDIVGTNGTLASIVGGAKLAMPQYPISFEPLADATLEALDIPITPVNPVLSSVGYQGRATATGSYLNQGGTFEIVTGTSGNYEIVISRDGTNFDPGAATNRVLRGIASAADSYDVDWDGKDNAGNSFPVADDYSVHATLRGGEYHAPMIDVESSVQGGPSITLVNPPNSTCPFTNVASTGSNCTRAFYDDRGYRTSSGTSVGTVGGALCSTGAIGAVPNPLSSDPVTGFDSTSTQRAFGVATATGNQNAGCNASATFGDSKGLDIWTYFPSALRSTTLDVLATPAVPVATDDSYEATAAQTLVVAASDGLLGNDAGTRFGVTAPAATLATAQGGSVTVASDGSFSYTPPANYSGPDSFEYTITDDAAQSDSATVEIAVLPVAVADTASTNAETPVSLSQATLTDNDIGSTLTVTAVGSATHGSVSLSGTTAMFTPAAGFSGTASFSYTVTDASGQSTSASVTVTVRPTAAADSASTQAETPATITATALLANDVGSELTVTSVGASVGGAVSLVGTTVTFTPADDFSGTGSFEYTVTDEHGRTASATVEVTVAPTAAAETISTTAETAVEVSSGTLLTNDHGTGLTVTSVGVPVGGTVSLVGTTVTFTPAPGFSGTGSFSYTATDAEGQTASATVSVAVSPVAVDDTLALTTPAGSARVVTSTELTGNDVGTALTVTDVGPATHGTVSLSGGQITFTPAPGFSGTTTFDYTVTDADGLTSAATVTLVVTPTAVTDTRSTTGGTALSLTAASLLANDLGSDLTVTSVSSPSGGTVVLDGTTVIFTPTAGFTGTASFEYTVTDAEGRTSTTNVTISVSAVSPPVTTSPDKVVVLGATGASPWHLMGVALVLLLAGAAMALASRSRDRRGLMDNLGL